MVATPSGHVVSPDASLTLVPLAVERGKKVMFRLPMNFNPRNSIVSGSIVWTVSSSAWTARLLGCGGLRASDWEDVGGRGWSMIGAEWMETCEGNSSEA